MPLKESKPDDETTSEEVEVIECQEQHLADLDASAKCFLATFSTIRGKVDDLARAESDLKRFELSIEQDRKRLQKNLEAAKLALRNARVQMAAELEKLDASGFSKITEFVKGKEGAGA